MPDRKHIERVLKVNGVLATAPDEEIRSVLLSAHYRNDEVDMALMVLRENIETKVARVDSIHKLLHTDQLLSSKEISKLLGIDVVVPQLQMRKPSSRSTLIQQIILSILATLIALIGLGLAMYIMEFGVFHSPAKTVNYE